MAKDGRSLGGLADGFMDTAQSVAENAAGQFRGVAHATYNAADTVFDVTGAAMNAVTGTAGGAAATVGGAAQKAAGAAARPFNISGDGKILVAAKTMLHRYQNFVSPVVVGQGGDFGVFDPDKPAVILRIEVVSSTEVKVMRWISWILTSFAILTTLALTLVKFRVNADEQLREKKNYFIATMIVCSIYFIVLLPMSGIFLYRYFQAWQAGRVWSRRRAVISTYSCILLFCQIANLTFMMIGASYAVSGHCNWQSNVMVSMGYGQWTTWNCTLIVLVALAHNGSVWKGETKLRKTKSRGKSFLTGISKSNAGVATDAASSDHAEKGLMGAEKDNAGADGGGGGSPASSYGTAGSTEDKDDGSTKDISPENPHAVYDCTTKRDRDQAGSKLSSFPVPGTTAVAAAEESGSAVGDRTNDTKDKQCRSPAGLIKRSDTLAEESDDDDDDRQPSFHRVNSHEPIQSSPPPALVIDAPWTVHLRKVFIWLVMQAMLTQMLVRMLVRGLPGACRSDGPLKCGPTSVSSKLSISFVVVAIVMYFVAYLIFSWRTDKDIRSRAYAEMRFARIVFGVGHEQVMPVFLTFTVCTIVLITVNTGSCWTFVQTWIGVVPLQTVGASMAFTLAYFYMPTKPGMQDEILHTWLQEFSWTNAEHPLALNRRNSKLSTKTPLRQEPMFCVETAIKLLYFSNLVYSIEDRDVERAMRVDKSLHGKVLQPQPSLSLREEAAKALLKLDKDRDNAAAAIAAADPTASLFRTSLSVAEHGGDASDVELEVEQDAAEVKMGLGHLEFALKLYRLTHSEIIYDKRSDTKVLLAWGETTLVVAFKGTSSFENVLTDLKLIKTKLPEECGGGKVSLTSFWGLNQIKATMKVHTGFLDAWLNDGYNTRVLNRVQEIIMGLGGPSAIDVLVTGHSLGGALAALAAFSIKKAYPAAHLKVYTYGQPRVGNRAFALDYNSIVEEHFSVINGQDPVAQVPKGSYKRVGDRVIIDDVGDIIVRPNYLEMHLIKRLAPKVGDHMLDQYRTSFMRIIKMQFTEKRLENGLPGARQLARWMNLNDALMGVNMSESELDDPRLEPMTREDAYKLSQSINTRKKSFSMSCGGQHVSCGCGKKRKGDGGAVEDEEEEDHDEVIQPQDSTASRPATARV